VAPTISRGSAGVVNYSHAADAFARAPVFTLAPRPATVFGGPNVDPAFDLTKIIDVRLRRDGSLVAAVTGTGLVAFDPTGKPTLIAKWGPGPDEVSGGRLGPALGDTLLYLDQGNHRIVWIAPSGKLSRMFSTNGRLPDMAITPVGELTDHNVVITTAGMYEETQFAKDAKTARNTAAVVALPSAGQARQLVGMPDVNVVGVPQPGTNGTKVMHMGVMYAPQAQLTVFDGSIISGTGDSYHLDIRDGAGKVVRTISVATARATLSPKAKQYFVAEYLAALQRELPKEGKLRDENLDLARHTPFTEQLPAFTALFGGNQKTLWVVDAVTKSDSAWTATGFNRDGVITGRLHGQGLGGPRAITDNYALIRNIDADGFVSFARYDIVPVRGSRH
jgi:hypothetical protein